MCHINSQVRTRVTLEFIELWRRNKKGQGWLLGQLNQGDSNLCTGWSLLLEHNKLLTWCSMSAMGHFPANGYTPFLLFGDPRHFEGLWTTRCLCVSEEPQGHLPLSSPGVQAWLQCCFLSSVEVLPTLLQRTQKWPFGGKQPSCVFLKGVFPFVA